MAAQEPGPVILLSSGETAASGRRVYDWLFGRLSRPIKMAVLETPAGFQPNSALVAGSVAHFVEHHLQNYQPRVTVVPARKRGTAFSPEDANIVDPLYQANVIYAGAGSPTYAVRQLHDSLTWHAVLARHHLGAAVILASAAAIAASEYVLPVYEIYKVGDDLYWSSGLDLFGPYGLSLAIVSHWDNRDGGADLDTSRGFVGQDRFTQLQDLLPPGTAVIGLDEHTALVVDIAARHCMVIGRGSICLRQGQQERIFSAGYSFGLSELGPFRLSPPQTGIPDKVWERARRAEQAASLARQPPAPAHVSSLLQQREAARRRGDWAAADSLRAELLHLGYQVDDTPEGPVLRANDFAPPL